MKLPGVAWRTLTGYDMAAVEQIAAVVHPGFYEAPEVLAERQRLYHNGAYLLEVKQQVLKSDLDQAMVYAQKMLKSDDPDKLAQLLARMNH